MPSRRTKRTSGHVTTPVGQGLWAPALDSLRTGADALSPWADRVLGIAITFPQFEAPGRDEMHEIMVCQKELGGWQYRVYGKNRLQDAYSELKKRGLFGLRRASRGRTKGGGGDVACVFSFGNEPWKHLEALEALPTDKIYYHHRRRVAARARRNIEFDNEIQRRSGAGDAEVVVLDDHRLERAG